MSEGPTMDRLPVGGEKTRLSRRLGGTSGLPKDGSAGAIEADLNPASSRRKLVEIRCGFAEMARKEADGAEVRFREARRACDERLAALARAQSSLDLQAAQTAKEQAHRAFRTLIGAARARSQVEMAAAAWLKEINRVNHEVKVAQHRIQRERQTVEKTLNELSGLITAAEAGRAAANAAMEVCNAARQALAAAGPDEVDGPIQPVAATPARADAAPASPLAPAAPPLPTAASPDVDRSAGQPEAPAEPPPDGLTIDLNALHSQLVILLLRRDTWTLSRLVDMLAAPNSSSRSHWQILLSDFVDAVAAEAIEDGWFVFPPGNPFWDLFSKRQAREVARGLAALGFRYDGLGEFANGHIPTQRDLALAVGHAGLLPVRIRFWPKPAEITDLFKGVRVASDSFIAARAPALTLGELIELLGRRAETLSGLWNEWPRIRPLLFSTGGG